MGRESDLTPQAKSAKVTWLLARHGELTTRRICELTGLSDVGARYLMDNISLADVPVWKPAPGIWRLSVRPDGTIVDRIDLKIVDR